MLRPSDEIITHVLNGLASAEQAESVARWFATDEGQEYLSESMDIYFNEMSPGCEELYISEEIPSERIWNKIDIKTPAEKPKRQLLIKIAAILTPLFILAGVAIHLSKNINIFGNTNYVDIYIPKGDHSRVVLKDGTIIHLNSETKLSYPEKFGLFSRTVRLEGEAYFDVETDTRKPFYIEMNNATIKVLGTAFNVKAYPDESRIKVSLDEGKINLITKTRKEYDLYPQQVLTFDKNNQQINITENLFTNLDSYWKDDIIVFNNSPLADVIVTLSRYYNVVFIIENKETLNYSYTLTTKKIGIENILKDFEKIAPVRFNLNNDTVKIQI